MKKNLFLCLLLMAAVWHCKSETVSGNQLMVSEVLDHAFASEAAKKVQSAQIVYSLSGKGQPDSLIVCRADQDKKFRFDVITAENRYAACRNGQDFWGYDNVGGVVDLTIEDRKEMLQDISFFALSFLPDGVFEPLTPAGSGLFRSSDCLLYRTALAEDKSSTFQLWVDKETGLLRLVKSKGMDGNYAIAFRNYRKTGGIFLAGLVIHSEPTGTVTLKLLSADWNVKLPDTIFQRKFADDQTLAPLQKKLADKIAARKAEQKRIEAYKNSPEVIARKKQKQIDLLKREIRILTIQIAADQKRLGQLEPLFASTRQEALSAAKQVSTTQTRYRSVWRGGRRWRGRHHGGSSSFFTTHRTDRNKERLAENLRQEADDIVKEYDKLTKKLTNAQIRLGDAQAALEKLTEQPALLKTGK